MPQTEKKSASINGQGLLTRGSGILLHVSSLPSIYGIGDLGPSAFAFVDFLHASGQRYWQVLPLNPTETIYGNSPYSSYSAFAANPFFISPELLLKEGWLEPGDLEEMPALPADKVDYHKVGVLKSRLMACACRRFPGKTSGQPAYEKFCRQHAFWLDDFALFFVLKEHFEGKTWNQWPENVRRRDPAALKEYRNEFREKIQQYKLEQFFFYTQWNALKAYCASKQVRLIGDIPIYVNFDSADVWTRPELFKLDDDLQPVAVAGVPPDYFSETGQRWGNPIYRWDVLKDSRYDWWVKRIKHNLTMFDYIRIDHFRGLVGYWEIPASETTAIKGKWVAGPVDDFLQTLREQLPTMAVIAEDLGIITPDVTAAMERFGLPGMKVLLFAFGGETATHPYIPENYTRNFVAYTGTHDNNTVKGWWLQDATPPEKKNLQNYLGHPVSVDDLPWEMITILSRSVADVVITPMQDVLGLGGEARMNTPATTQHNWQWRLSSQISDLSLSRKLADLARATGRI